VADVEAALSQAIDDANQGIRVSYTDAVTSARADATFADTLLACAQAMIDPLGYFAPSDVSVPLSQLAGQPRRSADFFTHLKRFAGPPSWILETRGEGRKQRYRFTDPLMKPFVIMMGITRGRVPISGDAADEPGGSAPAPAGSRHPAAVEKS